MKDVKFAFDKASVRRYDVDGMLHVELTPISKANVCVYYGKEIPDWENLGLEPDKNYRLLRDPEELAKAVETFNNKPLLNTHIAVSILNPPKESIIGATGSNSIFEDGYLKNSMVIWDVNSIIGVENKQQREISSSYRYRLDMTPGVYEGEAYDGVMRDIVCNHVAIVPSGRAGPDVFVYDSLPTGLKLMSKIQKIMSIFKPLMANDADPEAAEKAEKEVEKIIKDDEKDPKTAKDEMTEEEKAKAEKEAAEKAEKDKLAKDEAEAAAKEKAEKEDKMAMDSLRADLRNEFKALRVAERECEPLIGQVACDSAEEVYRMALKQGGVQGVENLPLSALRPMVEMLKSKGMANDAAPISHDSRQNVKSFFEGK